jgi:serine/threonine protein phosphatase PrpC
MTADPPDESADAARVTLRAWLVTDVGVVRDHNEDSAFMEPSRGIFIVADGMGGHAAGEVASAMAVDSVRAALENARPEIEAFKKAPTDAGRRALVQLLQNAVLSAHRAVFERGQAEADKQGMGTTLDVVLVAGPEAFVAHVGDSRTYLVRNGVASKVTTDHTVAEVLVIEGKLTIEEAQFSPLRTILVNAIGVSEEVGVEMAHVTLKRGDRVLLCSDGLHDYYPVEDEIAERLSSESPGQALEEMVELAKARGGHDNITGVVVEVVDVGPSVPGQLDGDPTQPVEVPVDAFAADEPTETAGTAFQGSPPRMPEAVRESAGRPTQPMRSVADPSIGRADTIPPPTGGATAASEPAAAEPAAAAAESSDDTSDDTSRDERETVRMAPLTPPTTDEVAGDAPSAADTSSEPADGAAGPQDGSDERDKDAG